MTIPSGYAQVRLIFSPGGGVPLGAEVCFGVVTSLTDPADVIGEVNEALFTDADWSKFWATNVEMTSIAAKMGPDATGTAAEIAHSEIGGMSGTAGAAGVATLVRKVSALGGRANRGRIYFPGPSETAVLEGGILDGSVVTGLAVEAADGLNNLDARDVAMVILHEGAATPTLVTSLQVQAVIASQRRRQRR